MKKNINEYHGAIAWFASNSVAANLLMIFILLIGLWTLAERITLEVFPEFESDQINIAASYRGATPEEVEQAVLVRIEEAISVVDGITQITSTAFKEAGVVIVEAEKGTARLVLDELKSKVEAITTFPEGVEKPTYKINQRKRQTISVVVSGELPEDELRSLGDQVLDQILDLPGITQANLVGIRPFEIAIEVNEDDLTKYQITFAEIVQRLRDNSVNIPAGTIKSSSGEIVLRTTGQKYTADEFAKIPLRVFPNGANLLLSDVAVIKNSFEENPVYAEFNKAPAVIVDVYRSADQNVLEIGETIRNFVAESNQKMPDGIELSHWRDRSKIVKLRLNTLLNSAWQGGVLVFLCLTIFLRLSVAIWVCIGIPISFLGVLAIMPELGVTLNIVSLFAFIIVLGIVVDDAIITGENIYTHLQKSESGLEAAINGTREVAVPVSFGLLTTLAAFAPLFFIEGRRGDIFAQIPMVIIPVLIFSWIESKFILPAHLRNTKVESKQIIADSFEKIIALIYRPLLVFLLRYRYLTIALFIGFTFIVLSFVLSGRYSYSFFPKVPTETVRATLQMQQGTSEQITELELRKMAKHAEQLQQEHIDSITGKSVIKNILLSVGWKAGNGRRRSNEGQSEIGQVSLELVPPEEREENSITTRALVKKWRQRIGQVAGVDELSFRAEIGRGGEPIAVQLVGDNFDVLGEVAAKLRERIAEYPGVFDIKDNYKTGEPELKIRVKDEAQTVAITTRELGKQVREAFLGAEVQSIQHGRDDIKVIVRYPEKERSSLDTLEKMQIRTEEGNLPLVSIAELEYGRSFADIHREDRKRVLSVTADIDKKAVDTRKIAKDLEQFMGELLPEYPGVNYHLDGELSEQEKSFGSLLYGLIFSLLVIYSLLAIPLRSWSQPLLVMLVIPFSVVGALLGHVIMDMGLSVVSVMGMLALAGIVVNDSLILVEWVNRQVRRGEEIFTAVTIAGVSRFRPILLTSITTFAGLTPLLLEKSTQAQFLIPMAVSLGFGILYATLLSLVLVPAGYLVLHDFKKPLGVSD